MLNLPSFTTTPPSLELIISPEGQFRIQPRIAKASEAEEKKNILHVSEAAAAKLQALCPPTAHPTLTQERFKIIKQIVFANIDKRQYNASCGRYAMAVQEVAAALFGIRMDLALVYKSKEENIQLDSPVPWDTSLHSKGSPWKFHCFCFTQDENGITIVDMVLKQVLKVRSWQEWIDNMWNPVACPKQLFCKMDANQLQQLLRQEDFTIALRPAKYCIFDWFSRIYGFAPPQLDHYRNEWSDKPIAKIELPAPISNQSTPGLKLLASFFLCASLWGLAVSFLQNKNQRMREIGT